MERLEDRVVLSAVDFDFSAQLAANPSAGAAAIAVIDANGDAFLDVVAGDTNGGTQIVTFLGNGTGGFTSAGAAPATRQSGFAIAVADFNRDGKQDFATALGELLVGNGNGTYTRISVPTQVGTFGNTDIIAVDVNGDSWPDLVACGSIDGTTNGNLGVALNNGAGGFPSRTTTTLIGQQMWNLAAGDFNADGKLDIAGAARDTNSVILFTGNGTGGFTVGSPLSVGDRPRGITVADFNGDNLPDIATANQGAGANQGSVSVLLNTGGGSFTANTVGFGFGFGSSNVRFDLVARDFDGDGDQDLMTTKSNGEERFLFFANNGAGAFSAAAEIDVSHPTPNGLGNVLVAGDFNGDGTSDLVSNSVGTAAVYLGVVPNQPPIAPVDADSAADSVNERAANGSNVGITAFASDPNSDTLTYSLSDDAGGRFAINSSTGVVTVANGSLLDGPGSHSITVVASDGHGGTSSASFAITINNVAPSVTANNTTVTVNEGQTATNSGTFSDPGDDDVAVSSSIGTISQTTGNNGTWNWSFVTNDGSAQTQPVSILATDSDGLAPTQTITFDGLPSGAFSGSYSEGGFTITSSQPAQNGQRAGSANLENVATASSPFASIKIRAANGGDFTLSSLDLGVFTKPTSEGSFIMGSRDGAAQYSFVGTATAGAFTTNASPNPTTLIDELLIVLGSGGFFGTEFVETVDNIVLEQASFQLIVNNVAPTATFANSGAVNEGSTGSVSFSNQNDPSSVDTAAGFRYAYDFDNNGTFEIGDGSYAGSGTATSATIPASYLADGPSARTVRGRILDKDGGFTDYTTAITVLNVAPTFEAGADETIQPPQLGAFSRNGIGITDPGSPETFSGTVNFGDGTGNLPLTINQTTRQFDLSHTFPNTNSDPAIATYHVVVTVNDGDGGSHTDAFDVTVNLNTPPVAVDDTPSTDEDHSVTINVLANDTDNQNNIDPSQTINLTSPSAGTLTNNGDGTFSYNPNGAFQYLAVGESATVTFDYRVFDAFGESDDGTVTLTITGVNDGPSVAVGSTSVTVNESQTASNSGTWSEIDASDVVTLTASAGTATMNANGTWSWSFNTNDGPDQSQTVTITANDGNGGIATTTFALAVNNVAPTLNAVASSHAEECGCTDGNEVSISGSFSDPGLDTHTVTVNWGDGTSETVTVNQLADTFAGTHDYANGGIYTITVSATDSDGAVSQSLTTQAVIQGVGLVDGVLYVIGTSGKDIVGIRQNDRRDLVKVNARLNVGRGHDQIKQTFAASDVDLIFVSVCEGDDQVHLGGGGSDGGSDSGDDGNDDGGMDVEIDAMIYGGAGKDHLRGGQGDNFLDGGAGDDHITGRRGDDVIVDQSGRNKIDGGEGNDSITTGDGDDDISGNQGNDVILAGGGRNKVDGGYGNDAITTGDGDDDIDGNQGDDVILAGQGSNKVNGGYGNDSITTGDGNDDIDGNQGNDLILAGNGRNKVDGGHGDDIIISGTGNDRLSGNQGNDVLSAGGGDDFLDGGHGRDVLIGGTGRDQISGDDGDDLLIGGSAANESSVGSLATVMAAWSSGDLSGALLGLGSITDDGLRDDLTGGKGNDQLIGGSGDKLKQ